MKTLTSAPEEGENLALGLTLAGIQIAVFFSFILYCIYGSAPSVASIEQPTTPFVYGLLVIVCGTLLTVVYVCVTNRKEPGDA